MKPSKDFLDTLLTILTLGVTALLIFFWVQSPLVNYTLQLVAILVITFLIAQKVAKTNSLARPMNLVIFTAACLLLVSETGGLSSPIFFMVYFLLFGVALLNSTPVVLALTLLIMVFFSPSLDSIDAAIQLCSLLLITPLAVFFGRQYLQLLDQQGEILLLKQDNETNQKNLAKQETTALMWLSINLKTSLVQISEILSNILANPAHLTPSQNQNLQKAHQQIHQLLEESQNVKQLIDEETD